MVNNKCLIMVIIMLIINGYNNVNNKWLIMVNNR